MVRCGADGAEKAPVYPAPAGHYPISASGGTPATGPGGRFNSCERIWCLDHEENFFIDHFASAHDGFVVHDEQRGDLFVPRAELSAASLGRWKRSALRLCGTHVHPWVLGKGLGTSVRHAGYEPTLGYDRKHFREFGTRLDPCCVNGLGSGFVHSDLEQRFPFGQTAYYRKHPEVGWQKPFAARALGAKPIRQ
jgi:hypothetical protein